MNRLWLPAAAAFLLACRGAQAPQPVPVATLPIGCWQGTLTLPGPPSAPATAVVLADGSTRLVSLAAQRQVVVSLDAGEADGLAQPLPELALASSFASSPAHLTVTAVDPGVAFAGQGTAGGKALAFTFDRPEPGFDAPWPAGASTWLSGTSLTPNSTGLLLALVFDGQGGLALNPGGGLLTGTGTCEAPDPARGGFRFHLDLRYQGRPFAVDGIGARLGAGDADPPRLVLAASGPDYGFAAWFR